MDDLFILKEGNFNKGVNSEKARKIFEKLNNLKRAFKKLPTKEQIIFTQEFEGKFRESTEKMNSIYSEKTKDIAEGSFEIFNVFFLLAVIFLGK